MSMRRFLTFHGCNMLSAEFASVCVLIINATVKLAKKAVVNVPTLIIFLLVAFGSVFTEVTPVIFVIIAAIAGIVLKALGGKKA